MRLQLVDRRTCEPAVGGDWADASDRWRCLTTALAGLGAADWRLNLVLIDDQDMAELNAGYREIAGVTDVLSFSYLQDCGEPTPDLVAGRGQARCDLWLDPLTGSMPEEGVLVGEVILAPRYVRRACRDNDWDLETELVLLIVHGALHVLGWRHDTDDERSAMREIESRVLAGQGLPHPLQTRS